jgi:uncharacterized membrane protein
MTFTNVFGGTTVYPAEVNYRALTLSANVTLEWPTEVSSTSNILASIMDVTPSGAGFTVRLPAANLASVGETALFFNVGASSFTVADNGGNTIASIAPGLSWQVYLTNNGSANGSWRATQYGAGTSIATAGSLVGAGIKAIGTTLNQSMDSTSLNSNYTVNVNDRADVFNWVGGAGILTIPSAATLGNDWFFQVRNSGTGAVTLQTGVGGQLINGASTLILNPGDSAVVFCDGSNFFTIGLGKSAVFAFDFVSIDLTGRPSPLTLTGANLNRVAYRFTGTITGNFQVVVPSTVQQYWVSNETTIASAPYTIEIKTLSGLGVTISRNQRAILYCDGTNVIDADTAGISLPLSVSQGGTGSTTAGGALVNLGGTSLGISLFTAASASAGRNALGSGAAGDSVFTAATAADARTAISAGTVNSVAGTGTVNGITLTGTVTNSGSLTLGGALSNVSLSSQVTGTLPIGNGGTGATTAALARTALGATTVGGNVFTLTNPSAVTFLRFNADNTVSALNAADFRTAIGAGTSSTTGTVTSVGGTGTVNGITLTGTVTASGSLTLGGTLSGVSLTTQVSGTLPIANGGTGATTAALARTAFGATTIGSNLFTLTNPSAITFPRFNADNSVSSLNAADFRTAIGVGTGTGTVTSVGGTGTVNGITLTGTVTSSGNLTLGGTLSGVSLSTQVTGTLPIANGGTGSTTAGDARTALGATTVGGSVFTLANPSAITFLRFNADNSVSALNAADFRTAIGAGTSSTTGTVTSVGGTGTVNGITLTGTVTSAGSLTLGGTLSGVSLTTQVSGTLPVGNGGTGITTTPSNGQIPIGNGTNYTAATLTAGNNTAITNASGSVTVGAGALTTAGTASGTLVAADAFKQVKATGGVTLPASVFSADQYVYIRNTTAGNITVTQGGSLTLRFVALTGDRTLARYGFMTVLYISATEAWVVGGVGVT